MFKPRDLATSLSFLLAMFYVGAAGAQPVEPPWANPQAMFETLFGVEGDVDEKVLAEINVSAREERQIGKRAVDAYLGQLKMQRLRVVQRGKDVAYLLVPAGTRQSWKSTNVCNSRAQRMIL